MTEKELVYKYVQARNNVEELKSKLATAENLLEELKFKIAGSLMDRDATCTAKYPELGSITLMSPLLRATYHKEDTPKVFDFVKKHGCEDIIKPTIHWSTFNSFVKQIMSEGQEIPEELINYYYEPSIRWNKGGKR